MSSLTPEQFPDIHHLIHLRDRLWARRPRGRAAVMVGAGFSLNAESRVAGNTAFPLWRDVTARMLDELRPLLPAKARKQALRQYASGSGSLTLAREYELTFGRSALDDLLLTLLPDHHYSPGELHRALLALPWADVFTTNYDTLLERTLPGEEGRYYDVVVQPSDLPNATPPRIVKLHGSLPATKPFIITDEDFRRYPRDFAPFVNTVQQSMMENDFVLLGFSGDDPNFLSWLGWVRDELRVLRPRVYLCGVLDMSAAQRLVLRERGVTVIDLGPLFAAGNQRHQLALTWLLASLRNGQALEPPVQWPHFPTALDAPALPLPVAPLATPTPLPPKVLVSFEHVRRRFPGQEPEPYSKEASREIQRLLTQWQQVREAYPGWVALPQNNRKSLLQQTKHLRGPVAQWVASLLPAERLAPLAELVWRLEKCVQPLYDHEIELCREVVQVVPVPTEAGAQEHWATLAFALLKTVRYAYSYQSFAALLTQLEPLVLRQPRYAAWRCWQAAMERLEHLDQPGARRWLRQWPAVPADPAWDLRRAGLWAELNELDTAERHALAALEASLALQPRLVVRVDMLSVEEAARNLLRNIRAEQRWQDQDSSGLYRPEPTRGELARRKQYSEYRCEEAADTGLAAVELKDAEPTLQRAVYESVNPYSGTRVRNRTNQGGLDPAAYQPAFDVLDSYERRGEPFRLANTRDELLAAAGKWLLTIALPRALGVLVRSQNDALLQLVDKAALAMFDANDLEPLLEKAVEVGEGFFRPVGARQPAGARAPRHYLRHVALALRLLGRTAFRLQEPLRGRVVQLALGVWKNWPHELSAARLIERQQFADFTAGLTAILTPAEVGHHLPLLLTAAPEPDQTESALESVPRSLLPAARPQTAEMAQAISTCLGWLARPVSDLDRHAGLRRLLYLQQLDWLSAAEQETFSQSLWAPVAPGDLPLLDEQLATWTVLLLPPYPGVDAPTLLKQHLLANLAVLAGSSSAPGTETGQRPLAAEALLFEVLHATRPVASQLPREKFVNRQWVDWTPAEARQLLGWGEQLLATRLPHLNAAYAGWDNRAGLDDAYDDCHYLGRLLSDVVLPALPPDEEMLTDRVAACARQLLGVGLPARCVLPLLVPRVKQPADFSSFTATSIRLALLHPTDASVVQDGAEACCRWAYAAAQGHLPSPPEALVYEYVVRLGLPGLPNLLAMLVWASDLLAVAPQVFWPVHGAALGEALGVLLQETTPPTWRERNLARQVTEQERLFQRPQIREQAACLAGQLAWLQARHPVAATSLTEVLADWEAAAPHDYLPEVRRAWQVGREDARLQESWPVRV